MLFNSLLTVLLAACLVACSPERSLSLGLQKTPYFRPSIATEPVTSAVTTSPGATVDAAHPTTTVQCKDSLSFMKDLSIPDGTTVTGESTLDKRWQVENNGNCNWGEGYQVRLIAGPDLGAQKEQALYPARSGTQAVIRIQFKAPVEAGAYRSAWQAYNARGEPFGDPFFIDIKVVTP